MSNRWFILHKELPGGAGISLKVISAYPPRTPQVATYADFAHAAAVMLLREMPEAADIVFLWYGPRPTDDALGAQLRAGFAISEMPEVVKLWTKQELLS